jgi:hypothetical protein
MQTRGADRFGTKASPHWMVGLCKRGRRRRIAEKLSEECVIMLHRRSKPESPTPSSDPWDVFELDDDLLEPEPEHGDFWGELDDDCEIGIG